MQELNQLITSILEDEVIKIIVSNKKNKESQYNKIVIRPIKENVFQFEMFTDQKVFHKNVDLQSMSTELIDLMATSFKQMDVWTKQFEYSIKLSKKDKVMYSKKQTQVQQVVNVGHNREKNYILKEGMIIPPLVDLGVFTKEGKVVNSKYDKYKQINRFVEIIDDVVSNYDQKTLKIIDFGCGKSYLTFILYYYLVELKGIKAEIIGLDLKADVIQHCNSVASKYNYENLKFEIGDINGYKFDGDVDMVITLHACDTATDYALYNAIKWNAKMIFSVPCCQHEFNKQMKTEDYTMLTKYGLIKERFAALATDAMRGSLLEACGYSTQMLEFIDFTHSPKNILIRAVKTNIPKSKKDKSLQEVDTFIQQFNVFPTLYKLLKKDNYI